MIPLFKPYLPLCLTYLDTILHSGKLSYGKWGKLFEQSLGEFIGETRIITVNSFNSAMLIAISAIDLKPGDEIIASPMSCLASTQPFATQHLKVVWADIDPKTGTLCPDSVMSKCTSKTKAIFHNHFCGYVGYIDEINKFAKEKGIIVVDDAIESFGSEYKGNKIGNTGTDITVFSFQTVRLPNTIDGGAIAFNNDDLYKKAALIRDYGIERSIFRDENFEINVKCDITLPGYGATLSEINSYIGHIQMQEIKELINIQRNNAYNWKIFFLENYKLIELLKINYDTNPNFWVFGLLTQHKIEFIKTFRTLGYYASGVHIPNNNYSVFGKKSTLTGVDEFNSKFVALPCGWWFNNLIK